MDLREELFGQESQRSCACCCLVVVAGLVLGGIASLIALLANL